MRYVMVSSAKSLLLEESDSARGSFIYIKKEQARRHGPKTEPCGTPENTSTCPYPPNVYCFSSAL